MKKLLPLILLFAACSKSNQAPPVPPSGSYISIQSVDTASGIMNVHIKIIGAAAYKAINLVVYKTDITGANYKYPVTIQEGTQIISCNKFSDSSPVKCQIQIDGTFSNMMSFSY